MQTFAVVCVLAVLAAAVSASDLSRGWGDSIEWRSFEAGQAAAKSSGKPLMLIVHKTWCGACKSLKPRFAENEEIAAEANNFVMVNVQDEEEPQDESFAPDGGYIPRILFLDSQGTVIPELFNKNGNPKYRYYYSDAQSIVTGMRTALEYFAKQNKDL